MEQKWQLSFLVIVFAVVFLSSLSNQLMGGKDGRDERTETALHNGKL